MAFFGFRLSMLTAIGSLAGKLSLSASSNAESKSSFTGRSGCCGRGVNAGGSFMFSCCLGPNPTSCRRPKSGFQLPMHGEPPLSPERRVFCSLPRYAAPAVFACRYRLICPLVAPRSPSENLGKPWLAQKAVRAAISLIVPYYSSNLPLRRSGFEFQKMGILRVRTAQFAKIGEFSG